MAIQTEKGISFRCGGSIINSKWIVTTRDCVVKDFDVVTLEILEVYPVSDTFVLVGAHQLTANNETGRKQYQAAEIVILPRYDLALIKVDGVIDTSIYTPICLPDTGDDFRGEDIVLTGWGLNRSSFSYEIYYGLSPILQEIELPVLSTSACFEVLSGLSVAIYGGTNETFNTLCFGDGEEGMGGCYGDSGGPLVVQKQGQERWTLAGIVSIASFSSSYEKCAAEGTYGIGLEISSFVDFIKFTAADGEFCENV
eukprot:TRINITY_DN60610_c0_g1_i1.p1 TRINITY_DN60610_c0_g1~~TRINITY_DN60610_c0_g1_i1.p1  ORF type:complete len:292 (-),score=36.49 TRINITY_DN60610_c0_g1_i1:58-819(-)